MTPPKRGLQVNIDALGRFPQADAIDERAGVGEPGAALVELGHWRAVSALNVRPQSLHL